MPRFIPPHLMALVVLLIIVLWITLVHHFRRSAALQRFVAETLGDNTPENALLAFEVAKQRLSGHLNDPELNGQMRQRIEDALGISDAAESDSAEVVNSYANDRPH